MNKYDFIFSNRVSHYLSRHLVFWFIFLIYFFYVNLFPAKPEDLWSIETYRNALELMIYFPVSVISVYTAVYFLLPRYILTGKYFRFAISIICLSCLYFSLAWLLTMLLAELTRSVPFNQLPVKFRWFQPVRYGLGLPLTSAALTTIVKLLKIWHQKQKENEWLRRQKITTELQLLKTQFQPHFLYDSLQHIYYLLRKHSPQSPETILKLSDLLSYALYENEKDSVSLEKEMQIIRSYLNLKKTFYDDRLWIKLKEEGKAADVNIEPLLLISLVEDCFDKFLQSSKQNLTVNLNIKTEKRVIYFQLACEGNEITSADYTDYSRMKSLKRIALLYPGRHNFDSYAENRTVHFLLTLETEEPDTIIRKEKEQFVLS